MSNNHEYLIIGADIVPTDSNQHLFSSGCVDKLIGGELLQLLNNSSFSIFNLEVPLTDVESPIPKCGPNLIAPTATVRGYQELGIKLLGLANNHIMDQDSQGLYSTINTLEQAQISYFGAGPTLVDASKAYEVEFAGKMVGVYACAEHEFSIAGATLPGANPFDPLWSFDHISELNKRCDYVIVLYHGGKEHYRYPSPQLRRVCRRLVDKGANLVVCQHSHCVGCAEHYRGGDIVYGQGNFLFDHSDSEFWQTGLLLQVDDTFKISYVPITKKGSGVRAASDEAGNLILSDFLQRSNQILEQDFVERSYAMFALDMCGNYLDAFHGKRSLVKKIVDRLTHGGATRLSNRLSYSERELLRIENYLNCEAHRELVLEGLRCSKQCLDFFDYNT